MAGMKKEILLESGTNELEVMEFTVSGNHFGINVAKVDEIMQYQEVTPIPNANFYVEGVFKPRNEIMTVINLAAYMNLPETDDKERNIFIITHINNSTTAFHVHTVEGIHRISWEDIEKPGDAIYGGEEGLATGIARFEGRLITIVDFEKIMTDISPSTGIQMSEVDQLGARVRNAKPILLVEDSPLLMKTLVEALDAAGYSNVIQVSNGKEAWELLSNFKALAVDNIIDKVSCVVTDIEMPQMDGHRLLKMIRSDEQLDFLPVIIFSSLINEEMRQKGEGLGATAQVTKPEIAKLVHIMDQFVL